MNKLHGKWTISSSDDSFCEGEYFDTKKQAIEFGKEYEEFEAQSFYVAQIESIPMNADELGVVCIEHIAQIHGDNDGEFGMEYLDYVKKEHIEELDKMLQKAILEWATLYDYHPKHFLVTDVELIEMEVE